MASRLAAAVCLLGGLLLLGCDAGKERNAYSPSVEGSAAAGKLVIMKFKCGSCHTIPGIKNADGVFGPPLDKIALRTIIAGNFPNTPDVLARWVMDPAAMKPKTAMPQLGLSYRDARNVVAFLETLH